MNLNPISTLIVSFKQEFFYLIKSSVAEWSTGRGNIEDTIIVMPGFFFFTIATGLAKSDIIHVPLGAILWDILNLSKLPMLFVPTRIIT